MKSTDDTEKSISFEELDLMLGDNAPFLSVMTEGPDNELHIVISATDVGKVGSEVYTENDVLNDILSECRPITPDYNIQYEIYFENYIIYQVRNESFATYFADEIRCGTYLIVFEKSRFLDNLNTITYTFKSDDGTCYPGNWTHYGIYTQNQVIDIISHYPPVISRHIK